MSVEKVKKKLKEEWNKEETQKEVKSLKSFAVGQLIWLFGVPLFLLAIGLFLLPFSYIMVWYGETAWLISILYTFFTLAIIWFVKDYFKDIIKDIKERQSNKDNSKD
tara:strand:- start:362 stop:682 length:321 start_codon:yes stop_codon:yes gene_type:complete